MKVSKESKKVVKLGWLILWVLFRIIIFSALVALGIELMNRSSWTNFVSGVSCLLTSVTVWLPPVFRIIEKLTTKN